MWRAKPSPYRGLLAAQDNLEQQHDLPIMEALEDRQSCVVAVILHKSMAMDAIPTLRRVLVDISLASQWTG